MMQSCNNRAAGIVAHVIQTTRVGGEGSAVDESRSQMSMDD
jgi:hypothetical protein